MKLLLFMISLLFSAPSAAEQLPDRIANIDLVKTPSLDALMDCDPGLRAIELVVLSTPELLKDS